MQLAERVNLAVKAICGTTCPTMALFRNATAPNIMLIAAGGKARLVYSPQFFAALYGNYGDPGILAILAHEIGHALDDTLGAGWVKNSWPPELRADSWAACTLAKARLSPADLGTALKGLAKYPAPMHPAWNQRLPVLRTGYTQCGGDGSQFDKSAPH